MKKIKVIIFGIDGILIKLPHYFDRELVKNGGFSAEKNLDKYYRSNDYYKCLQGKAKVENVIKPFLNELGWKGTIRDYLNQQYEFEGKYLDLEMLLVIKKLRESGIKCFLGSNQERCRLDFLLDGIKLRDKFDRHFVSCEIGFQKFEDEYWNYVISSIKKEEKDIQLKEIVFFDDKHLNINTALRFGINAIFFIDAEQMKNDLVSLGIRRSFLKD